MLHGLQRPNLILYQHFLDIVADLFQIHNFDSDLAIIGTVLADVHF